MKHLFGCQKRSVYYEMCNVKINDLRVDSGEVQISKLGRISTFRSIKEVRG